VSTGLRWASARWRLDRPAVQIGKEERDVNV